MEGGYEPIAKSLFTGTAAQRLLLEYDDERSGGFEPLRWVPDDRTVVLGLVTTKRPTLEPVEELATRVHDAARFVPLDRLAISPQCGFASSILGNALSADAQRRKLHRVVEAARVVWGDQIPLPSQ